MRSAYSLVRDSTNILLEATPRHLELESIAKTIRSVSGVKGVHDLHVWTITSGLYALSGHVTVDSDAISQGSVILEKVAAKLKESFGIEHVTLQMEKETLENIEHESSRLYESEVKTLHPINWRIFRKEFRVYYVGQKFESIDDAGSRSAKVS